MTGRSTMPPPRSDPPPAGRSRFAERVCRLMVVVGLVGLGLLAAADARAQSVGDPEVGLDIAKRWCASCHMVTAGQQNAQATGVPTFSGIARMPSTTAMSLRVFLQTPHMRMPDLHLTHDEIANVSAYILSLKGL